MPKLQLPKRPRGRPPKSRDQDDALADILKHLSAHAVARMTLASQAAVSNWRSLGMPSNPDGTYDWYLCVKWFRDEKRSHLKRITDPAAATTSGGGGGDAPTYPDMDDKYKALSRKQRFEREAGLLIERSEAEKDYMRIILTLRASLLALPDQIASQLADLSAAEAATVLRERLLWLCSQYRDGRVPITPEAAQAIDEVVASHITVLPPITPSNGDQAAKVDE
jgi:hypothetical protein